MTTQPQDKMRAEFEAHMLKLNACVRLARQTNTTGEYRTVSVQRNWELWQAACAQQSAQSTHSAIDVDALANEIRRVDGSHALGAGALAEALIPFLSAQFQQDAKYAPRPSGISWDSGFLTVVYKGVDPGPEAMEIGSHPKVSAMSWSHAINDRDEAIEREHAR